jgi:hypothetical protein
MPAITTHAGTTPPTASLRLTSQLIHAGQQEGSDLVPRDATRAGLLCAQECDSSALHPPSPPPLACTPHREPGRWPLAQPHPRRAVGWGWRRCGRAACLRRAKKGGGGGGCVRTRALASTARVQSGRPLTERSCNGDGASGQRHALRSLWQRHGRWHTRVGGEERGEVALSEGHHRNALHTRRREE